MKELNHEKNESDDISDLSNPAYSGSELVEEHDTKDLYVEVMSEETNNQKPQISNLILQSTVDSSIGNLDNELSVLIIVIPSVITYLMISNLW